MASSLTTFAFFAGGNATPPKKKHTKVAQGPPRSRHTPRHDRHRHPEFTAALLSNVQSTRAKN